MAATEEKASAPQNNPIQVDPTKNVLDLVAAESKYQNDMRIAETKFQSAMRDAEMRRIKELNTQRMEFDRMQADLLRAQVATNASVFSAQVDKMTTLLSERIAKLEQFRYESSGRGLGASAVVGYMFALASLTVAVTVAVVKFSG